MMEFRIKFAIFIFYKVIARVHSIIGGQQVENNQIYPFFVSLRVGQPEFAVDFHFGGGSVIDERHVLTAAHCITELPSLNKSAKKINSIFKA